MGAVLGYEPNVVGSNGYEETAGSYGRRDHRRPARARPGMSRDDLVTTNEKIVKDVTEKVIAQSARRDPDRRLEPARRDVPRREERLRVAEGARVRHGRDPRHRALLDLHRVGDRLVGEGRAGDGARRPRRPDGPGRLGDDRRRHPAAQARRGRIASRRWSSGRRRAAASSSTCSARRRGTRRARPPRRWSTRSCSTRSASCPAPRTSRASTASTGLYMGVPVKLGAKGVEEIVELELSDDEQRRARGLGRAPCARSSAC